MYVVFTINALCWYAQACTCGPGFDHIKCVHPVCTCMYVNFCMYVLAFILITHITPGLCARDLLTVAQNIHIYEMYIFMKMHAICTVCRTVFDFD